MIIIYTLMSPISYWPFVWHLAPMDSCRKDRRYRRHQCPSGPIRNDDCPDQNHQRHVISDINIVLILKSILIMIIITSLEMLLQLSFSFFTLSLSMSESHSSPRPSYDIGYVIVIVIVLKNFCITLSVSSWCMFEMDGQLSQMSPLES